MRSVQKSLVALVALSSLAPPAMAQGTAPGGFNRAAFEKFRNQHKYTFQLQRMLTGGLFEMERQKSTQLKPAQAKQLLTVVTALQKQPKLTQDQARDNIKKVQRVLDQRQLAAVDRVLQRTPGGPGGPGGMRPGGPGGPGGMRPGGPGGPPPGGPGGLRPGGNRPPFDPNRMRNFNPFRADPSSPRYAMEKARNDSLVTFLRNRAAGKPARLDLPRPGGPGGPPRPGARAQG